MARTNIKGQLSGSVGPVSYRVVNGMGVVQSKPGRGNTKMAKTTLASASEFGRASTMSKNIRRWLLPLLQNRTDVYMYSRFTAKVYQALINSSVASKEDRTLLDGDLSILNGFQFNNNVVFNHYYSLNPELSLEDTGALSITLPEFSSSDTINSIAEATSCDICYMVTALDSKVNTANYTDVFKVRVPLNGSTVAAQQWTTPALKAGQLVIVAAAVFYFRKDKFMGDVCLNSKQLHPCELAAAFRT